MKKNLIWKGSSRHDLFIGGGGGGLKELYNPEVGGDSGKNKVKNRKSGQNRHALIPAQETGHGGGVNKAGF